MSRRRSYAALCAWLLSACAAPLDARTPPLAPVRSLAVAPAALVPQRPRSRRIVETPAAPAAVTLGTAYDAWRESGDRTQFEVVVGAERARPGSSSEEVRAGLPFEGPSRVKLDRKGELAALELAGGVLVVRVASGDPLAWFQGETASGGFTDRTLALETLVVDMNDFHVLARGSAVFVHGHQAEIVNFVDAEEDQVSRLTVQVWDADRWALLLERERPLTEAEAFYRGPIGATPRAVVSIAGVWDLASGRLVEFAGERPGAISRDGKYVARLFQSGGSDEGRGSERARWRASVTDLDTGATSWTGGPGYLFDNYPISFFPDDRHLLIRGSGAWSFEVSTRRLSALSVSYDSPSEGAIIHHRHSPARAEVELLARVARRTCHIGRTVLPLSWQKDGSCR